MENIVLIGGGNQAHYTIDIVEKEGKYNIIGIVDSIHEKNSIRFGYRILGKQEDIQQIVIENKINAGIITIGDNWSRYFVYKQMAELMPDFAQMTVDPKSQCQIARLVQPCLQELQRHHHEHRSPCTM